MKTLSSGDSFANGGSQNNGSAGALPVAIRKHVGL
jgi:hypothetical protein